MWIYIFDFKSLFINDKDIYNRFWENRLWMSTSVIKQKKKFILKKKNYTVCNEIGDVIGFLKLTGT